MVARPRNGGNLRNGEAWARSSERRRKKSGSTNGQGEHVTSSKV
jgi:hypothetical protein